MCNIEHLPPLQRSGSKYLVAQNDQAWIQIVREEVTLQTDRLVTFQRRVEEAVLPLLSLLNFDVYNSKTRAALAHVAVPINELMDLCEFMLAFPSAAEIKYFSTKTRLRDLSVDNDLHPTSRLESQTYPKPAKLKFLEHQLGMDFLGTSPFQKIKVMTVTRNKNYI